MGLNIKGTIPSVPPFSLRYRGFRDIGSLEREGLLLMVQKSSSSWYGKISQYLQGFIDFRWLFGISETSTSVILNRVVWPMSRDVFFVPLCGRRTLIIQMKCGWLPCSRWWIHILFECSSRKLGKYARQISKWRRINRLPSRIWFQGFLKHAGYVCVFFSQKRWGAVV